MKHFVFCVLLLIPFSIPAVDLSRKGGAVSPPLKRVQGENPAQLAQLLKTQKEIHEINAEIHNRWDATLLAENAEERSLQAERLITYLQYVYDDYKLNQKLEKIWDLAINEEEPSYFRNVALKILGEHSIPNTLIRSSLEFMANVDEDPVLKKATRDTLGKLKTSQSRTGQKFSDLLAYSHESDNIKKAIALIWVAIYEDERQGNRLAKWLSNDDPYKIQIGLLIVEELKSRNSMMLNRIVKNKIRQLKKRREASPSVLSSPLSHYSETCGHFFGHGPVVPRKSITL